MFPKKIKLKKFIDKRGSLTELISRSIKKKFIYSILSTSKECDKRNALWLWFKGRKLVYIVEGKILDVCINLIKGKTLKKFIKILNKETIFIPRGYAQGYRCYGKKNT